MKKCLCLLALLCLTAGMAHAEIAPLSESDFAFTFSGTSYALGSELAPLVAAIEQASGEQMAVTEAESCMFSGKDREFELDGLILGAYPIGRVGADALETVIALTDAYETARGARVGMTKEEIIALYGSSFTLDYDQMIYQQAENGPMLLFGIDLDTGLINAWTLIRNTQK